METTTRFFRTSPFQNSTSRKMNFTGQVFKINDVREWSNQKNLELSPKFQRRSVWNAKGKSYLIDSIVKGFPLPPFFIRERINAKELRSIREVIDGQQRIRTILGYIAGEFAIQAIHNKEFAKLKFSELPEEVQENFLSFTLSVNVVSGIDDSMVYQMFSRLNAYSVPLNAQEKLNSEFTGIFKQKIDELSQTHLEFWLRNKIITEQNVARMREIEMTAELVILMISGLQNGKKVVHDYYKKYDSEEFPFQWIDSRFIDILGLIEIIFGDDLKEMEFRRSPIFYSLFSALYDIKFGFKNNEDHEIPQLNLDALDMVRDELSQINEELEKDDENSAYSAFLKASKSSTDKLPNRIIRHDFLKNIFSFLFP